MSETTITALIAAVALLIAVAIVVFFLRGKIKNAEVKAGGITAKLATHEPDKTIVKNVDQTAKQGSNHARIHTNTATVEGIKQTAQKDNVLDIGNPHR